MCSVSTTYGYEKQALAESQSHWDLLYRFAQSSDYEFPNFEVRERALYQPFHVQKSSELAFSVVVQGIENGSRLAAPEIFARYKSALLLKIQAHRKLQTTHGRAQ